MGLFTVVLMVFSLQRFHRIGLFTVVPWAHDLFVLFIFLLLSGIVGQNGP